MTHPDLQDVVGGLLGKTPQLWVEGETLRIHKPVSNSSIYIPYKDLRRKKGKIIEVVTQTGKTKKIRVYKNVPKGCSAPRRVCIKCLSNVIQKLSKNYDLKICKDCLVK